MICHQIRGFHGVCRFALQWMTKAISISERYIWNLASYCHNFNTLMWLQIAFSFTKDNAMTQSWTSLNSSSIFNFLKTIGIWWRLWMDFQKMAFYLCKPLMEWQHIILLFYLLRNIFWKCYSNTIHLSNYR